MTTPPTPSRSVKDWRGAQGLVHHGSCTSILFHRHSNSFLLGPHSQSCSAARKPPSVERKANAAWATLSFRLCDFSCQIVIKDAQL